MRCLWLPPLLVRLLLTTFALLNVRKRVGHTHTHTHTHTTDTHAHITDRHAHAKYLALVVEAAVEVAVTLDVKSSPDNRKPPTMRLDGAMAFGSASTVSRVA